MPVRKFRSALELPPPPRGDLRDPAYRDAVRSLLAMTAALSPPWFAPGVYKYRSIEEANEAREAWEREAARRRLGRR